MKDGATSKFTLSYDFVIENSRSTCFKDRDGQLVKFLQIAISMTKDQMHVLLSSWRANEGAYRRQSKFLTSLMGAGAPYVVGVPCFGK